MKISIITVSYNSQKTIQNTIDSINRQNFSNLEYIVVDGMSTDGTWEIINKNKNSFTKIIHEPDNGLYDAMNKGILNSTGDIIGIINSDDWYEDGVLNKVFDYFKKEPNIQILYGDMTMISADGTMVRIDEIPVCDLWVNMVAHPTVFVKKEVYEKYGIFNLDYKIAADYEMILRFYSKGLNFKYINENLAYFNMGGISYKQRIKSANEVRTISYKYLDVSPNVEKYKKLIEKKYFNNMLKYIFEIANDDFKNKIKPIIGTNRLCIWGASVNGARYLEKFKKIGIECEFFIDSDNNKIGELFHGLNVFTHNVLDKFNGYVFIASSYTFEIEMFIKDRYPNVFILDVEVFKDYDPISK